MNFNYFYKVLKRAKKEGISILFGGFYTFHICPTRSSSFKTAKSKILNRCNMSKNFQELKLTPFLNLKYIQVQMNVLELRLPYSEMFMLSFIMSYEKKYKRLKISNAVLAEDIFKTLTSNDVSIIINSLRKKGLVSVKYFPGKVREVKHVKNKLSKTKKSEKKFIVVTKEIWFDKTLNNLEKLILSEILSFENQGQFCFTGNEYFADLLGRSASSISRAMSNLKKMGRIKVYMETFKVGNFYKKRTIKFIK